MDEHQYELPDDLLVGRRAVPLEALGERDSLRPKATPSRRADHELIRNEMVEAVAQWIERQKTPSPISSASRVAGGGLSTANREVAGSIPASLMKNMLPSACC